MKQEFMKDKEHLYLIIEGSKQYKDDFQIEMLKHNHILGLLDMHYYCEDDVYKYYYDISNKNNLHTIWENGNLTSHNLKNFLRSFYLCAEKMEEYLLDIDKVLLNPENIYMDIRTQEFYFCFYIDNDKIFIDSMKEFIEFLIESIDYKDKELVEAVYALQQVLDEEYCTIKDLIQCLENSEPKKVLDDRKSVKNIQHYEDKQDIKKDNISLILDSDNKENRNLQGNRSFKENRFRKVNFHCFSHILEGIEILFVISVCWGIWQLVYAKIYSVSKVLIIEGIISGSLIIIYIIIKLYCKRRVDETHIMDNMSDSNKSIDNIEGIGVRDISRTTLLSSYKKEREQELTTVLKQTDREMYAILKSDNIEEKYTDIIINQREFLIGQLDSLTDFQIPYKAISRIHLKISYDKNICSWTAMDLNSTNGSYINDIFMKPEKCYNINNGDKIQMADLIYIFCITDIDIDKDTERMKVMRSKQIPSVINLDSN